MEYGAHTPLACGGRWLAGRWFVVFGEPPKTAREPRALPEINGGDGCLENSPRILKVPSTLNSGFFLFTPLIMNSLGLQKGERNQHRFFSDIL